eukprot:1091870-Ditylum_brightwellii.AAC.1
MVHNGREKLRTDPRKDDTGSMCLIGQEKLGQNRVGVLDQISRIVENCKSFLIILETIQRKKMESAVNVIKKKGCNMNNKLLKLWRGVKSWLYLIFVIVSIQ